MDDSVFINGGIEVVYQDYKGLVYSQYQTSEFIPNLSALDFLFNCGIEQAKKLFWENVRRGSEVF